MAKILVDAPSRTLRALYGDPPPGTIIESMEPTHEGDPTCAPKRGTALTDLEWYAAQEARYGLYAAQKNSRPKQNWWGRKEETAEQQTSAQAAPPSPERQPQRLTVQQQLRQQRQIADTSGVSETRTPEGIYWFTIESEEVDA